MKIFKMVLNCVLPTILVFSIVLNVLLLCGFEFTKETSKNEPANQVVATDPTGKPERNDSAKTESEDILGDKVEVTFEEESSKPCGKLVYEDDNFVITYLETTKESMDIVLKFNIENKSNKPLTILFTDVVINGQQVFTSGLTCENLLPKTDTIEDFVLLEKDWGHFTNSPTKVSFKIKLVNSKSRLDWYESNKIHLTF